MQIQVKWELNSVVARRFSSLNLPLLSLSLSYFFVQRRHANRMIFLWGVDQNSILDTKHGRASYLLTAHTVCVPSKWNNYSVFVVCVELYISTSRFQKIVSLPSLNVKNKTNMIVLPEWLHHCHRSCVCPCVLYTQFEMVRMHYLEYLFGLRCMKSDEKYFWERRILILRMDLNVFETLMSLWISIIHLTQLK